MATSIELQEQVDHLSRLLAERDRKAAEDKAAALAAEEAKANALSAAERLAAAEAERERVRTGLWVNHIISTAPPTQCLDIAALDIPSSGYPPGCDPSAFAFSLSTPLRADEAANVADTALGRALANLTKTI
jgi:hypothetical protein